MSNRNKKLSQENSSEMHNYFLNRLIRNLDVVDENLSRVAWVLQDGKWYRTGSCCQESLCDLLLAYENRDVSLLELKSNRTKRNKARDQLYQGRRFVREQLPQYTLQRMKIVYYDGSKYTYEVLPNH